MTSRRNILAKIHIAKKDLGLGDDDYRLVLETVTGRDSCGDMSDRQLNKVLDHFKGKGWMPKRRSSFKPASKRLDIRKIYALWWELFRGGKLSCKKAQVRSALNEFVRKRYDVDNPEWLAVEDARKIIEALKAMNKREGK